jgi:hypothetical protein
VGPRAAIAIVLLAAAADARADDAPRSTTQSTAQSAAQSTTQSAPPKRSYESRVKGTREKREAAETTVRADEARRVAGTQGDALKVVQDLPGVARAAFGAAQLIVWGSEPQDTRVVVDGVEIPALYHLGGLRSTVNGELVRSLSFQPGGYGAAYGRGLGGLVRIDTRPLPAEGVHGYAGADLLDASGLVTAAIGKRLQVGVAGRYSYLDRILGGLISPDVGDYFPIPRYDDYQLKATLKLREGEELSLLFLAADDHLRQSVFSLDPAQARTANTDTSSYRLVLRYTRVIGDGARVEVAPFFGYDDNRQGTKFGVTPSELDVESYRYGVRADYRRVLAAWATFMTGLDLLGTRSSVLRFGSLATPPREGDIYVFGQPPGGDVGLDRFHVHVLDAAPYAFAELRAGPVTITPGVRVDAWLIEGDQLRPPSGATPVIGFSRLSWSIDPRVHVAWHAHPRVTLDAACGLYHQAPEPQDLGAAFGNPTLGIERALHVTAGAQVRITETLGAELVGFYKELDDLVSRSPSPSPPVAGALVQDGSGRSYGGQLLVRQELWRGLSGWVSYTLSRSERRDHPGLPMRLFDYDQTHVLAAVANYEYRGWSFGARFRLSTGFPRTPVAGAYYDIRDDQYQPIFGAHNSIRIPNFYQLDLRVDRTFTWRRLALNLYLDVENVTYQRNPEEIVYNESFSTRGYITGLPTLAVLGARVLF